MPLAVSLRDREREKWGRIDESWAGVSWRDDDARNSTSGSRLSLGVAVDVIGLLVTASIDMRDPCDASRLIGGAT